MFNFGQATGGPQTLGAMPNPGAQAPGGLAGMFSGAPGGGLEAGGLQAGMQNPMQMGLMGAGMSMLDASGREGGLGEALGAGIGGGFGGVMQANAMQQEADKDAQLQKILGMQSGIGDAAMAQGAAQMPGMGMQPPQMGALGGGIGMPQQQPQMPGGIGGLY